MDKRRVARQLVRIAMDLISGEGDYEYVHDPDHQHKPQGGGWKPTEKGWTQSDTKKPKDDDIEEVEGELVPAPDEAGNQQPVKPAKPHQKAKASFRAQDKIQNVLKAHGLDENSDEIQEMAGFKKTLGQRVPEKDVGKWYVRNIDKLKKDFVANMSADNYKSPEAFKAAQKRINDMPKSDFGKVLAAVHSDDEDEM